jgi:hypothetical protein
MISPWPRLEVASRSQAQTGEEDKPALQTSGAERLIQRSIPRLVDANQKSSIIHTLTFTAQSSIAR